MMNKDLIKIFKGPNRFYKIRVPLFMLSFGVIYLLIIFVCSCATQKNELCYDKAGRDCSKTNYITRFDDWDSCYLRGCSFMECGCFDLAIMEFKKAIIERYKDARAARTYGMHFLGIFPNAQLKRLGYFPHRELGIIHYKAGRIEEAIAELERSLNDSPSSRAMYYLNKARKKWLKDNGLDLSDPSLKTSFPLTSYYITNELNLTIKGQAEDDQFVSELSINGDPIFIELSSPSVDFSHSVSLKRGHNLITITANDLVGRTAEKRIEIMVDRTGPIINLAYSPIEYTTHEEGILIQGVISDESCVEGFSINNSTIDIEKGKIATFNYWINLARGPEKLTFRAVDVLGNETSGSFDLSFEKGYRRGLSSRFKKYKSQKEYIYREKQDLIMTASLDIASFYPLFAQEDTPLVSEDNEKIYESVTEPFLFFDPLPNVTIDNHVCILGKIQYKRNIAAINIYLNGRLISRISHDFSLIEKLENVFTKGREKVLLLGEIIELEPGGNKIIIEIINETGVIRKKVLQIIKKKEKILDKKYRLCIAVFPVEDLSKYKCSKTLMREAFINLEGAFVNQKRFQMVEREKIKEILMELRLSTSVLADNKADRQKVKEKIKGAEKFFFSHLKMYGTDAIEWGGKMVDTETTNITSFIDSKDIYLEGDPDEIIPKAAKILAMKIRNSYPLCKGSILKKKGGEIQVSIGKKEKIDLDTKLIVYREDELDPIIFCSANVKKLSDNYSWATLLCKEEKNDIRVKDLVITK